MKLIIKIVFVVVFVAGCNSATLGSLTKQLTNLETELIGARNADDAAAEVAAAGELRALASTAESNASKAKTTPDVIAFYRIAATAAWQGESNNVVALGTSLPELVTAIVASFKKETDLALGNLLGSNIFNVLSILGITSIVTDIHVSDLIQQVDMLWMLGITMLILPLMLFKRKLARTEGVILLLIYVYYTYSVII